MQAQLTFNLSDDAYEYWVAINGFKFRRVLDELDQKLRAMTKHGQSFLVDGEEPVCRDCDAEALACAVRSWIGGQIAEIGESPS